MNNDKVFEDVFAMQFRWVADACCLTVPSFFNMNSFTPLQLPIDFTGQSIKPEKSFEAFFIFRRTLKKANDHINHNILHRHRTKKHKTQNRQITFHAEGHWKYEAIALFPRKY